MTEQTPLFACHGIGMDARFFDRQAEVRPIHGFNMPGFGGTAPAALRFDGLAQSLADQIDAEGGRAHVMGHSMGGMVALELAATQPQKVASLILCNTTPAFGGRDDSFRRAFVSARLAPLEAGGTMADVAKGLRAMCGPQASARDICFLQGLASELPEAAYRHAIACLVTFDRRDALADLRMPVVLIGGEDDQAAPAKTMRKMADQIAGADCHILPGGHMTPVEQSALVNQILREFLDRAEK